MGHKVKQSLVNSRVDFFYHAFRNVLIISIPLVIISATILSSLHISATDSTSSTDTLSFNISSSCTLSSVVDESHNAELINGTYIDGIGQTTITTLCNDGNGYSIYANGYSNNEEGNNKLVNTENSNFNIISGTAQSGTTSNWAMSLNNLANDPSLTPPTIENAYNNTYGIVPNEWTKVASLPAKATDMVKGSSLTTTYAVYTSSSQYAGTYNGQVKYMLVHPSYKPAIYYMQRVADWKDQLGMEESVQAIDKRDGKSYWVTKLKDGNVWMTQNLDFDINSNTTLNSDNTDLNVIYNGQFAEYNSGYTRVDGVIYWKPKNSTLDFVGGNDTIISGWSYSNTAPYSANKTNDTNTGHASLGNYYNWTATIASNDSSSLTNNTLGDITQNPQNSICPKGWRLPTISSQSEFTTDSTNEFARLNYLYNSGLTNTGVAWFNDPLYFVAGGLVDTDNRLASMGIAGCYNSSTVSTNQQAYRMCIDPNSASLVDGGKWAYRGRGNTVRCVAR